MPEYGIHEVSGSIPLGSTKDINTIGKNFATGRSARSAVGIETGRGRQQSASARRSAEETSQII